MKFELFERELERELDEATINKVVSSMRQIEANLKQMKDGQTMTIKKQKGEFKVAIDMGD